MSSKWVIRELEMAMVEGKRIIPLLYRKCDIRADLKIIQAISFLAPITYETACRELLKALGLREIPEQENAVPLNKSEDFGFTSHASRALRSYMVGCYQPR